MLRLITLFLLLLQWSYWVFKSKEAEKSKPRIQPTSFRAIIEKLFGIVSYSVIFLQLLGIKMYPFSSDSLIQYIGFILFLSGLTISITARKRLDSNWTHAYEYQIKRNHSIVTEGIYRYIRHPIYTSTIFMLLGTQLIVESYLVICVIIAVFICYYWGKREEKILIEHFGITYKNYMKKTKMFIPYLF